MMKLEVCAAQSEGNLTRRKIGHIKTCVCVMDKYIKNFGQIYILQFGEIRFVICPISLEFEEEALP